MHLLAPDLSWKIPPEFTHRCEQRLLVHTERNDGGGKRAIVQGRPLDGTEAGKRSGFLEGTRRRIHVHGETWAAHGATHLLLGFRQDLQTMENESPDTTVHDAVSTIRRDGGIESGRIVEWLRGRPVHQGRATRPHTAESAKDIILNNASSLDETLAEDRYKHNLRKVEIVPRIRGYGPFRRAEYTTAPPLRATESH